MKFSIVFSIFLFFISNCRVDNTKKNVNIEPLSTKFKDLDIFTMQGINPVKNDRDFPYLIMHDSEKSIDIDYFPLVNVTHSLKLEKKDGYLYYFESYPDRDVPGAKHLIHKYITSKYILIFDFFIIDTTNQMNQKQNFVFIKKLTVDNEEEFQVENANNVIPSYNFNFDLLIEKDVNTIKTSRFQITDSSLIIITRVEKSMNYEIIREYKFRDCINKGYSFFWNIFLEYKVQDIEDTKCKIKWF